MIVHNNMQYYTYDEAANELHSTKNYLYILVSQGKLKSEKIGHGRKRYISENEINAHLNIAAIPAPIDGADTDMLPVATPQPFPIQSQSVVALSEIRQGYAQLTETLTASFSNTVEPLVKTAIDTDMENFFTAIGNMLEKVLNRMYSMSKEQYHSDMTPEQFSKYMMQDIELPTELKELLLASTIEAINNVEKAIASKT